MGSDGLKHNFIYRLLRNVRVHDLVRNPVIALKLPLPPTINHYFARRGSRTFLPAKVWDYRRKIAEIVASEGYPKLTGRLSVFVAIHPADRRRQDIDNRAKGLLDAFTHAGLWEDDEQIDELHLLRREIIKGGLVRVLITEMGGSRD